MRRILQDVDAGGGNSMALKKAQTLGAGKAGEKKHQKKESGARHSGKKGKNHPRMLRGQCAG